MKKNWGWSNYVFLTACFNFRHYQLPPCHERWGRSYLLFLPFPHYLLSVSFIIIALWGLIKCSQFTQWFSINSMSKENLLSKILLSPLAILPHVLHCWSLDSNLSLDWLDFIAKQFFQEATVFPPFLKCVSFDSFNVWKCLFLAFIADHQLEREKCLWSPFLSFWSERSCAIVTLNVALEAWEQPDTPPPPWSFAF